MEKRGAENDVFWESWVQGYGLLGIQLRYYHKICSLFYQLAERITLASKGSK